MRGPGKLRAIIALCLAVTLSTAASGQSPLEQQVLSALNAARTDPAGFARNLRTFRTYFHQASYSLPGSDADVVTEEGVRVVDETIAFLGRQVPLAPLAAAEVLSHSAAMLATEQARSGLTGHVGEDGSLPGTRARRVGGGEQVAEVIAYGAMSAEDVIRQLIVDDGVADRGHRSILYSPALRFAGVSCGPHREFGSMCVIDLSDTPGGFATSPLRFARLGMRRGR